MANQHDDGKRDRLKSHGVLHPNPTRVTDPRFRDSTFFDPCDLVQVKYEMLRKVRAEGAAVSDAANAFGLSRPTYYQAQEAFEDGGLPALLPAKKGPRGGHKLTEQVVEFIEGLLADEPLLSAADLAERVRLKFDLVVHPRSVTRALENRRKKAR